MSGQIHEIESHPQVNYMTRQTRERLQRELTEITGKATAAEKGLGETFDNAADWHDNFAYDHQRQQVSQLYQQKMALEQKLQNVSILQPNHNTAKVDVGNTVQVLYTGETEPETYTILGNDDTRTRADWVSFSTPLAKALLGAAAGDTVNVILTEQNRTRTMSVKVVAIAPGQF